MKLFLTILLLVAQVSFARQVIIGSKSFSESIILSEILNQKIRNKGLDTKHIEGMGATIIVWQGLLEGSVDIYPEYSGTISSEILKSKTPLSMDDIRSELKNKYSINVSKKIGFNNSYALVMKREKAQKLGIKKISDLKNHPDLVIGISHEYLKRKDGWKPLLRAYGLKFNNVSGFQHDLAYRALDHGKIDITDTYTTSSQKEVLDLIILEDDLDFFPRYEALYLYRDELPDEAIDAMDSMAGKIDEQLMDKMNSIADKDKSIAVAVNYAMEKLFPDETVDLVESRILSSILERGKEHIHLVSISMIFAIFIGILLGFLASKYKRLASIILTVTSILQTIPGLALLALLIPLTGISELTAIIALLLYSLLPIVSNTYQGFTQISREYTNTAKALGLSPFHIAVYIKAPMAMPSILTGIRTSLVINVGTATLAALIGVGGFGAPILAGLSLNDQNAILMGAIPAALLAALCQIGMIYLEKLIVAKGIRLEKGL